MMTMLMQYVKDVINLAQLVIHLLNAAHVIVHYRDTWILPQVNNYVYVLQDIILLLDYNNVCFVIQIV